MKSARERQIEIEEAGDIPTHYELTKIVQELTLKLTKMEEKMEEMQKWVEKRKKKINVVLWLNTNSVPFVGFNEWVNNYITIKTDHLQDLMENTLFTTIQKIIEYNLDASSETKYPICCFSQKQNIFYICEKKEDTEPEWRHAALTDITLLLKVIQNKLTKEFLIWKTANQDKFNEENSRTAVLFNKAIIKLFDMSFTQDATMSRIKTILFTHLKIDIKQQLDYEFEF
jgi:hypothetical protein